MQDRTQTLSHSSDVTAEFLISLARIGSVPGPALLYSWKNGPGGLIFIIIILDTILNRITNRRTIVDQPDSLQVYNYTRR